MSTWSEVKDYIYTQLTLPYNGANDIQKFRNSFNAVINQINAGSTDPQNQALWDVAVTYPQDTHPVFWRDEWFVSNIADNLGIEPMDSGGVVDPNWRKVSASAGSSIDIWEAKVYPNTLEIVFDSSRLYYLDRDVVGTDPYSSIDFTTELNAGKWKPLFSDAQGIFKKLPITSHGFFEKDVISKQSGGYILSDTPDKIPYGVVVEVIDPDNINVWLGGFTDRLTGLTADTQYYIDSNGQANVAGYRPLFYAISATEAVMNIQNKNGQYYLSTDMLALISDIQLRFKLQDTSLDYYTELRLAKGANNGIEFIWTEISTGKYVSLGINYDGTIYHRDNRDNPEPVQGPVGSTNVNGDDDSYAQRKWVYTITGLLANLATSDKSNLVAAINELKTAIDAIGSGSAEGLHPPVQDVAALKALDTTSTSAYPDKYMILVEALGLYRHDRESTATGDDNLVVEPTTGVGRWLKMSSPVSTHAVLDGLQGGTTNEYYHLTAAELAILQSISVFAQSLLDDADAATARDTLGLGDVAVLDLISYSVLDIDVQQRLIPKGTILNFTAVDPDDTDTDLTLNYSGYSNRTRRLTLQTNVAEVRPSGLNVYNIYYLEIKQDATGGRTIGGITAGAADVISIISEDGDLSIDTSPNAITRFLLREDGDGNIYIRKLGNVGGDNRPKTFSMALSAIGVDAVAATDLNYWVPENNILITDVWATVFVPGQGTSLITADLNVEGISILSTKCTIDSTENTSKTAATPPVISDGNVIAGEVVSADIDQVGDTVAGQAVQVHIKYVENL